jgi:hypothetical protein
MKVALFTTALLLGSWAFGQQQITKPNQTTVSRAEITPDQKALNLTNLMITDLGLDGAQTSRISEINLGIANKNYGVRTNASYTPELKQEIIQSNNVARKAMYKEVMTAAQYATFETLETTNTRYAISAL